MTNIQRVGMINSNNTQRNSDHDFTKLRKRALGNQGGVESKEQFIFDNDTKKLSAGSDIATAYILCTRPASNPIPNQKFLAQFEFTGSLDFLNITNGDKIFIEIKENLVKDPTLIEDLDSQTSYNQGLGIGEIKMAKNYPSHSNYLKLYERNEGQLVDLRKAISLPAIDEVAQRTDSLEEKLSTAEGQISQLVEAGTPSYLGITGIIRENYTLKDYIWIQNINTTEEVFLEPTAFGTQAHNEEIHICRLGSGISTNQLKIKLAKKGYPTQNVEVEIKKGEYNGDRGWRYGTWEVLAHASINSSSITAEPTTITVSLNKELLFEKNIKYVVVLRKRWGNVDSNNHYLVYADITQYSNVFGYVDNIQKSVKGYSPNIIYCHSEGFTTSTLAKKRFDLLGTVGIEQEVYRVWGEKKKLTKSNNWQAVVIWNPPYDGVYTIHSSNLTGGNCRVTIDGESISISWDTKTWVVLKKQQTIRLERMNPYDFEDKFTIYFLVKITQWYKYDRISTLWLPASQVNKDEELEIVLSGEHNTYFVGGQLIEQPKTTVTTGSIPLGNAVGFIPYVLPSWRIIHLPFYE